MKQFAKKKKLDFIVNVLNLNNLFKFYKSS